MLTFPVPAEMSRNNCFPLIKRLEKQGVCGQEHFNLFTRRNKQSYRVSKKRIKMCPYRVLREGLV